MPLKELILSILPSTGWYLAVHSFFKGTKYVCGCREYCKAIQVSYISFLIVLVLNYNLGQVHFYCIQNFHIKNKLCGQRIHDFVCADRWRRIIQIRDSLFAKSLQAKCSLTFFQIKRHCLNTFNPSYHISDIWDTKLLTDILLAKCKTFVYKM